MERESFGTNWQQVVTWRFTVCEFSFWKKEYTVGTFSFR